MHSDALIMLSPVVGRLGDLDLQAYVALDG